MLAIHIEMSTSFIQYCPIILSAVLTVMKLFIQNPDLDLGVSNEKHRLDETSLYRITFQFDIANKEGKRVNANVCMYISRRPKHIFIKLLTHSQGLI